MLVAAYLVHPGLNAESLYDIAWTYALYLESFALLPQIHLFTKSGIIEIDPREHRALHIEFCHNLNRE